MFRKVIPMKQKKQEVSKGTQILVVFVFGMLVVLLIGQQLNKPEVAMSMIERVQDAFNGLDVEIESAEAFEVSNRIVIQYVMEDDELWLAEQNLKDIVCAVQGVDTEGYGLRIGGNMTNGLTGLTATIEPETLAGIDCSADVIDWASVADEYSVASGLQ